MFAVINRRNILRPAVKSVAVDLGFWRDSERWSSDMFLTGV